MGGPRFLADHRRTVPRTCSAVAPRRRHGGVLQRGGAAHVCAARQQPEDDRGDHGLARAGLPCRTGTGCSTPAPTSDNGGTAEGGPAGTRATSAVPGRQAHPGTGRSGSHPGAGSPDVPSPHREQYSEMAGHLGFYRDGWKLLALQQADDDVDHLPRWRLYDVRAAPRARHVAASYPDKGSRSWRPLAGRAWHNTVFRCFTEADRASADPRNNACLDRCGCAAHADPGTSVGIDARGPSPGHCGSGAARSATPVSSPRSPSPRGAPSVPGGGDRTHHLRRRADQGRTEAARLTGCRGQPRSGSGTSSTALPCSPRSAAHPVASAYWSSPCARRRAGRAGDQPPRPPSQDRSSVRSASGLASR